MKKTFLSTLAALILLPGFSFAQDFNLNSITARDIKLQAGKGLLTRGAPRPEPANAVKDLTFMVYINGRNNLSEYGKKDLNEMETVGSTSKMNVVVELAREHYSSTERYLVKKDNHTGRIGSDVIEYQRNPDMGDWKHLVDFALWAKANYPAKKYVLVIWNHGDGWKTSKGISYDDKTGNHISTPELGMAMKEIGKVDVLAMDACLMQMAEVAYEVKDYADFVVASEEVEPGAGYSYDRVLSKLSRRTSASAEKIAKTIVEQYGRAYSSNAKATQSAIRTAALPGFVSLLNDWSDTAIALEDKKPLLDAVNYAESFHIDSYRDLYDFIRLVSEKTGDPALKQKSDTLNAFIETDLVTANTSMRARSHGVSVYLTKKGAGDKYARLAWSSATRWDEFLNSIKTAASVSPSGPLGGCVDPGAGASLSELMEYMDCLTAQINALTD